MKYGATTFRIMTYNTMDLIVTLSIKKTLSIMTLGMSTVCHYAECYAFSLSR